MGFSSGEIQLAVRKKLKPRKEVWPGDRNLGVIGVEMVPEAMEVDDITQRGQKVSKENL